jgi:tRNA nucleotidyltransferase (CCA-adding enzyme)
VRRAAVAELLGQLPGPLAALARALLRVAEAGDLSVHLVGGPVRDWMLGRALRDLDLVVEEAGGAEEIARGLEACGWRATRHDRFGTVVLSGEGAALDLATARRERYAHPGALPEVEPGSLEEDLLRRDFTVNALALPLSARARSQCGGQSAGRDEHQ